MSSEAPIKTIGTYPGEVDIIERKISLNYSLIRLAKEEADRKQKALKNKFKLINKPKSSDRMRSLARGAIPTFLHVIVQQANMVQGFENEIRGWEGDFTALSRKIKEFQQRKRKSDRNHPEQQNSEKAKRSESKKSAKSSEPPKKAELVEHLEIEGCSDPLVQIFVKRPWFKDATSNEG